MAALDAVDSEVAALIDHAVEVGAGGAAPRYATPVARRLCFVLRERAMPQKSIRQALNEALAPGNAPRSDASS